MTTTLTLVPVNDIHVPDRIRKSDSTEVIEHIENLRVSLRRFGGHPSGLLQPLLLDENSTLLAGWCRFSAAVAEGWPTIPCYYRNRLKDEEIREAELEENFRRLNFTWQEEVQAVVEIHRLRQRQAAINSKVWTQQMTGDLLGGYSDAYVSNCCRIFPRLGEDAYKECSNITDAVRVWYREKEDAGVAELARRTALNKATAPQFEFKVEVTDKSCVACGGTGLNSRGGLCAVCVSKGRVKVISTTLASPTPQVSVDDLMTNLLGEADVKEETVDLSNSLFQGDSIILLRTWPDACVDHIITDAPYAIDVAMMQQATTALMDTSRVEDTHNVDENLLLYERMFPVFHRILKDGGFFITWCDAMWFRLLVDQAEAAGFHVQHWPLIWMKTSPCKNQAAHLNFTKDYEIAIVCRKGNARLPSPVTTSRVVCPNDAERESNPFAKPFKAWEFLINSVSIQGQVILEPFAGEGSGVIAGLQLNRRVIAIEKDEAHYNYLMKAVKEHWTSVFRKVKFV